VVRAALKSQQGDKNQERKYEAMTPARGRGQGMDVISSDVLVIGGGIAGCFAALRANEIGANVVVLEKATIRRGGAVGPGMDHLSMGISPETMTFEEGKEYAISMAKELLDPNVVLAIERECYKRVQDLEKFGVKVREDDGTYFIWKMPERRFYLVSYRGVDTKVRLAEAVRKTKVRVVERTMGVDLITRGDTVAGAVAFNVRDGRLTVFRAKATILCTGDSGRQYIEPDGLFMTWLPPTNTGDGQAMAYRAGEKLANMEQVLSNKQDNQLHLREMMDKLCTLGADADDYSLICRGGKRTEKNCTLRSDTAPRGPPG
jgi:succinate dehydrogenase/fumarate reductase flavoprotein subunit